MRSITNLLLISSFLVFSLPSLAAYVKCYSHGRIIFSDYVNEVAYNEKFIVFKDRKSKRDVFILADCIVRL